MQQTLFEVPVLAPYVSDWRKIWCDGKKNEIGLDTYIVAHPISCDFIVTPGGHVEIVGDGWKIVTDRLRDGSLWRKFEVEGEIYTHTTEIAYPEKEALVVEFDCNWGIPDEEMPSQIKWALGGRYVFHVPW